MPDKPTTIVTEIDPELLSTSHAIASLVEVIDPVTEEVILEIDENIGGSVSLDATAGIRGTLDLTLVDDGSGDVLPTNADSPLAPFGNELRVSRGIETANVIQLVRLGIFRIVRPASDDQSQVRVSGLDRAHRYVEASFLEPYNVDSGTEAITAIEEVLGGVWAPTFDLPDVSYPLPPLIADVGDDRWAFAQGIATAIGCELYHDDNGIVTGRQIAHASEASAVGEFAEGPNGVLLGVEREWDREPLYNHWTASSESTGGSDDGTISEVALDDNPNSPTYFYGDFGRKPNRYSSQYIQDIEGAQNVANSLLARSLGAPDVVNFDVTVDPTRRPSDVIRITREQLNLDEYHVLDSVSIPLEPAGVLNGRTRALVELAGG